jgi:hypothetical protein
MRRIFDKDKQAVDKLRVFAGQGCHCSEEVAIVQYFTLHDITGT